jgi:hypothetical protein
MVMNRSPLLDRYQGQDRGLWRELGTNVYETIRQRFLVPAMILDSLKALQRALAGATANVKPENVPATLSATGKELAA